MCYMDCSLKKYYNFERYLKNNLSGGKPVFPEIQLKKIRSGQCDPDLRLGILCNEILNRSLLLTIRFAKMIFSVIACIGSPASLLTEKVLAPNLAWERFCKQARYFTAESFEFIGVVVCSILLLPFNRNTSPTLVNTQAWIEQKAESISGEKELVDSIQKIIESAKAKKELLLQARRVIGLDQKDKEKWVEKAIDFDIILNDMDISKRRRICRNYEAIPSQEKLDDKLVEIGSIISDRIDTVAIPQLKKTLSCLKGLFNSPEQNAIPSNMLTFSDDSSSKSFNEPSIELLQKSSILMNEDSSEEVNPDIYLDCDESDSKNEDSSEEMNSDVDLSCDESDSLETKLEVFKNIQSEINQTIDQLHEIHDPTDELKKACEDLNKELEQAISDAYDVAKREFCSHRPLTFSGLKDCGQRVRDHFFLVTKKSNEIQYIYSYKNVTESGEDFSQNFVSDLLEKITECRKLLESQHRTWNIMSSTIPLDRQRALEILGLTATVKFNEIRRSYLRLSLIHHPDKGGQEEVFKKIKEAYELLQAK